MWIAAGHTDLVLADRSNERLRIDEGFRGFSNTARHVRVTASLIDRREQSSVSEAVIDRGVSSHDTGVAGWDTLVFALRPQALD